MPSTKQQVVHERFFEGMNFEGVRPHLLDDKQWYRSFLMRHFESRVSEVPRKRELYAAVSNHSYPLSTLASIPSGFENFGLLIGMTDQGIWRMSSTVATRVNSSVTGAGMVFNTDGQIRRWGTSLHNNRLFFVNPLNSVGYTDGTLVRPVTNAPMGMYVDIFYDRVVVGRPIFNGTESPDRIQWSSLYDFTQWTPKSQNEADSFDCVEYQVSGDGYNGVTGLRRLGSILVTYTPSAIYASRYVGLPWVITTEAVFQDVGNGLPWTLAAANRSHFFLDMRNQTFLEFDGLTLPREIGQPIKKYFFADLTTDDSLQAKTFAYVDLAFNEIHWVYPSTSSTGALDREVVYNFKDRQWWSGAVEDVWSFSLGVRRAKTVDELTGTCDALTGTADQLSNVPDAIGRVYGSSNARLLREEVPGDTLAQLINRPTPYLETGDIHYGDIECFKEVESMAIHSTYDASAIDGVQLQRAKRDNIDDAVSFVAESQLWTPTLREKRLSAPRIAGRVFRFKFQPHLISNSTTVVTRGVPTTGLAMLTQIARSTGGGGGGGGVAFDASSVTRKDASSTTFSSDIVLTGARTNAFILASIEHWNAGGLNRVIISAVFNGSSMVYLGSVRDSGNVNLELWGLSIGSLAAGIYTLDAIVNDTVNEWVIGLSSWKNVNQLVPTSVFASASGSSAAPSLTIASGATELVVDTSTRYTVSTTAFGTGQTSRWSAPVDGDVSGDCSSKAGAASVVMSRTLSGSVTWAIAAVSLKT